jgi:hypothetical protein
MVGMAVPSYWTFVGPPGPWAEQALCRAYTDQAARWTDVITHEDARWAVSVCQRCPVSTECLAYGAQVRGWGVWGSQLLKRGALSRATD